MAEQEVGAGRLDSYNTRELTSMLYAYGRLVRWGSHAYMAQVQGTPT